MPTSMPSVIPTVVNEVMRLRPKSILDVGVGMGKFGLLFREYLEGWGFHRYCRERWQVRLEGVEIFPQYIQPWHKEIYDVIHRGDIRKLWPLLPIWTDGSGLREKYGECYDLVYMGDVIEHFPKADGLKLVKDMPFKWLIVSTPNFKTRTTGRNKENVHQDHLSVWTAADFRPFRHKVLQQDRMLVVEVVK